MGNMNFNLLLGGGDRLESLQHWANMNLGPHGLTILLLLLGVSSVCALAVLWMNFEQLRELRKMYKYIKQDLTTCEPEPGRRYTMCDFNGFKLRTTHLITLATFFCIGGIAGMYMGDRINVLVQLILMYFPVWKLAKSTGLQAQHIKIWSGITTFLFVWTCIKMVLITITYVGFMILVVCFM